MEVTYNEVSKKVKEVIIKTLNLDMECDNISDNAFLYEDLGIDSIDSLDLMLSLEEEFSIKLTDKIGGSDLNSIDAIVEKILENMQA